MKKIVVRFNDIKNQGVVKTWGEIQKLIDEQDFPEGFRPTKFTRAWFQEDIDAWLRSRPSASDVKPPLRGWARQRSEARKLAEIQNSRPIAGDPPESRGRT